MAAKPRRGLLGRVQTATGNPQLIDKQFAEYVHSPKEHGTLTFRMYPLDSRQIASTAQHSIYVPDETGKPRWRQVTCLNYDHENHALLPSRNQCPICAGNSAPRQLIYLVVADCAQLDSPPSFASPFLDDGTCVWNEKELTPVYNPDSDYDLNPDGSQVEEYSGDYVVPFSYYKDLENTRSWTPSKILKLTGATYGKLTPIENTNVWKKPGSRDSEQYLLAHSVYGRVLQVTYDKNAKNASDYYRVAAFPEQNRMDFEAELEPEEWVLLDPNQDETALPNLAYTLRFDLSDWKTLFEHHTQDYVLAMLKKADVVYLDKDGKTVFPHLDVLELFDPSFVREPAPRVLGQRNQQPAVPAQDRAAPRQAESYGEAPTPSAPPRRRQPPAPPAQVAATPVAQEPTDVPPPPSAPPRRRQPTPPPPPPSPAAIQDNAPLENQAAPDDGESYDNPPFDMDEQDAAVAEAPAAPETPVRRAPPPRSAPVPQAADFAPADAPTTVIRRPPPRSRS